MCDSFLAGNFFYIFRKYIAIEETALFCVGMSFLDQFKHGERYVVCYVLHKVCNIYMCIQVVMWSCKSCDSMFPLISP